MSDKKITLVWLLCITCGFLQAQPSATAYRAVNWTIYNGLSQGENYFMIKDANGFLWTGTKNGLNRFDGSLVKNYYHDPHNSHSIVSSNILGFTEDSLHNIWIGTDRGLSRLDFKADTFTNFPLTKSPGPNHDAIPFWATRDKLYAQEAASIVVYDIRSLKKKRLVSLSVKDGFSFGPSPQYSILDERAHSIWMLRGVLNGPGGGLLKISLKDGVKRYYSWPCFRHVPNHDHTSEAMRLDQKRNSIWINSRDGLIEFTLADEQFHAVDALKDLITTKDYNRFVGIDLDRQDRVWFATQPAGLLIYDPATQLLTSPFPKGTSVQNEISAANSIIYCDRDGMVWTGAWLRTGIFQLIPYSPAVKLFTPNPRVPLGFGDNMAILFHDVGGGQLWVVTTGSLYQFDKKSMMLRTLDRQTFPGYKANEPIIPVLVDTVLRKAWISNAESYFEMNLDTRRSMPVTFEDSTGKTIGPVEEQYFLPFKEGWLITGVYHHRKYIFTGNKSQPVARAGGQIPSNAGLNFSSVTDDEQFLFLKQDEAEGNLTYRYARGRWLRVSNITDSLQWTSIFFNTQDQSYWVAGENKLFHFTRDFKLIRIYGNSDGLPELVIVGLIADNKGNIWFHTDRSIHQLNVATGEISMLTEKDGFEKQNFALFDLNYKDQDGDLYFGGGIFGSGFNRVIPAHYTNPPSSLYIQSLEVNQKPFPLTTGVNDLKALYLRYSENRIDIETGIIDYYSRGTSHMRYRLEQEGKKENWQYGPANYTIRFEDLQPGRYTLHMQASNAALQFNGPEKLLYILVRPPWYKIWWAYLLFLLTLAFAIWGFIYYRSVQLIKANHMLENKVQERTEEVTQQKEEIEAQRDHLEDTLAELKKTQKQLIQAEKMASLGELTAGIAHEIQNPLNFINNFSEVSQELIVEMKDEISHGRADEVRSLANDIEQNLGKIGFHGKRADAIVKGMLQHSRISTGHKELTDINALADEFLRLAYHGLRAKNKDFNALIETRFDVNAGKINIVAQDIGRVLLNLFNNALYAVNEKSGTAGTVFQPTLTVSTSAQPGTTVITVADNGDGIPQKIIDKIFQPFFTTKPTGQGTGLGLSVSYDIVKAHGGEIRVESKLQEGTEFMVMLPNVN